MPHDLGKFGEEPYHPIHFSALDGVSIAGMPDGGYVAQRTQGEPLIPVMEAMAEHLRVPLNSLTVCHEGQQIDTSIGIDKQSFAVSIPASHWIRKGRKVELVVNLLDGVKTGEMQDMQKAAEDQKNKEEKAKMAAEALIKACDSNIVASIEKALEDALREDPELVGKIANVKKAEKKLEDLRRIERLEKQKAAREQKLEETRKLLQMRQDNLALQLVSPPQEECEALLALAPTPAAAFHWARDAARKKHEAELFRAAERATKLGFEKGEFQKTLAYVRERAPLIIHCDFTQFGKKIAADTHYRNLFEIGTGRGCTDKSYRASQEDQIFNNKYNGSSDFDRPKYGVLNFTNDPCGVSRCHQYGKDYILLKRARLRTTFASDDTFTSEGKNLGTTDYYAHILQQYKDPEFIEAIKIGCNRKPLQDGKTQVSYKEVQIHGEIKLSEHIAALVVHADRREQWNKGSDFMKTMEELQVACNGCPIYWTDSIADMTEVATISKARGVEDWSEEPDKYYHDFKKGLLSGRGEPARVAEMPEMQEDEQEKIRQLFRRHGVDAEEKLSSTKTPIIDAILKTCNEGLPDYVEHRWFFAKTLRDLFAAFNKSDEIGAKGAFHRRSVLTDLKKAFQSLQPLQARAIEKYSDEVAGSLFERQIRGFLAERKEGFLDEVILEMHPQSDRTDITIPEEEQFAHIVNAFRQNNQFGITGIDHARADRHQVELSGADVREARKRYEQELDVMGIVDAIVHDINQPSDSPNRRFDTDALREWAKENLPEELSDAMKEERFYRMTCNDIYWDDRRTWLYMQVQPDVVQIESERSKHPWLDRMRVLEILCRILARS